MDSNSKSKFKSKAARKKMVQSWCKHCVCSDAEDEVRNCGGYLIYATGKQCAYYAYRTGDKTPPEKLCLGLCKECNCGEKKPSERCSSKECPIKKLTKCAEIHDHE